MNGYEKKLARHFDGESADPVAPSTPEAQAYLAGLQYLRDGARAVAETPQISDAQFASFMDGIRERIDAPAHGRGIWAKLSLVAAALVVAMAVFVIWESKNVVQPPVAGAESIVESASSDIRDVTVKSGTSEDGNAVVWVTASQVDMW